MGGGRGAQGPHRRPRAPLTWGVCQSPGGRGRWLSASPSGPSVRGCCCVRAGAETVQLWFARRATATTCPSPDSARSRGPRQRRMLGVLAVQPPPPCTPAGLRDQVLQGQRFMLGLQLGEANPNPHIAAHVNAPQSGCAVPPRHCNPGGRGPSGSYSPELRQLRPQEKSWSTAP